MTFVIDPLNPPEDRPGVYRLVHLETGRSYVGKAKNLLRRYRVHARDLGSKAPKLRAAIVKYGLSTFYFEPIYITFDRTDEDHLTKAEAVLIAEHDAVSNGFNIHPANGAPLPPEFNERVREALRRPDVRERHLSAIRAAFSRPKVLENVARANAEVRKRPGWNDRVSRGMITYNRRPEVRLVNSKRVTDDWSDPVKRENNLRSRRTSVRYRNAIRQNLDATGKIWITDGTRQTKIPKEAPIPDGWHRGRGEVGSRAGRAGGNAPKKARTDRGTRFWINDGNRSTMHRASDPIPDGWTRGRILTVR